MHKTNILLRMLIYTNYARSKVLNQMQPKFYDEIEIEDLRMMKLKEKTENQARKAKKTQGGAEIVEAALKKMIKQISNNK